MKNNYMYYSAPRIEVVDVVVEAGFGVSADIGPGGGGGELHSTLEGYEATYEDTLY